MLVMRRRMKTAVLTVLLALLCSGAAGAVETAPRISDREIVERLTKLEAGQTHLATKIEANTTAITQLQTDMQTQFQQLRQDINARFAELGQLMLGMLGAFAALVTATIGFALWDRRTMVRPFESRVKAVEDELARDRENLHSLLEAFRSLGQSDEQVAAVLRQVRLL